VDKRFELFVKPLIETYKFFGIDAYYHPINDVHVNGKKIVGTGAGTIGEAQVVTGNFLFDFDYSAMINSIHVPNSDFRDSVAKNLNNYLTNMNRELENPPQRIEVRDIYKKKCEEILGLKVEFGNFTDIELREIEKIENRFLEESWLFQTIKKPSKDKLFKIHLGVWIGYMNHNFDKGSLNALITMKDNCIEEIKLKITSQEILNYSIENLENSLIGVQLERDLISEKVKSIVQSDIYFEWVECIYKIKKLQLQQSGNGTMARSD